MKNNNNPTQLERKDMKIYRGDYPNLQLDTNYRKGTACNMKGYGCK